MTNKPDYRIVRLNVGDPLPQDAAYLIGNQVAPNALPIFITVAFSKQYDTWITLANLDPLPHSIITKALAVGLVWRIERVPDKPPKAICPHCRTLLASQAHVDQHITDEHSTVYYTRETMQEAFEAIDCMEISKNKRVMRDLLILNGTVRTEAEDLLEMSRDIHPMEMSSEEWVVENNRAAAFTPDTPDAEVSK